MEFSSFTLVIFPSLVFLIIFLLGNRSKLSKLPPGPRKLPLIGNLHNLVFSSDPPHRILRDLSKQYGPLMLLKLGEISTLVVSSPEAAKQVLKTHDTVFASRPSLLATDSITYQGRDLAFAPYGDYWRQVRKICTLELFSPKRVKSFGPLRVAEVRNLCRWIASKADGATVINLTERVGMTTYDIITQSSIGKKTDQQACFVAQAKRIAELIEGFTLADLYPSIKLFSMIGGFKKKIATIHQALDEMLENIIHEHKLQKVDDYTKDNYYTEDLLDVLLKFQDDPELPLSTENVKGVLLNVFAAGIETSATTVDWAMAEMLKQPRILKMVQDEVRRIYDSKGYVDESSIDELNCLKLVIKETFRMHPPIPLLLPRQSMESCEIDGYQIPFKTRVLVNAWAMGRDPKYWEDPESFNPDRFLEKAVDYKGNDFEYIPFGGGRRICPGMTFGLANIVLPLAMLLYHFDWALPNQMKPEELDMTEHNGMAVRRTNELHVLPVVRRPLPVE